MGDDCSMLTPCEDDCSGHGLCSHGACHCAPGYTGVNCSVPLACPNGCSAHGVCRHGACHCEPGYSSTDCSVAPKKVLASGLRMPQLMGLSVLVLVGGVMSGVAVKAAADRRRRVRLMRFIEEGGDGQGPFVSEVRQAITG